jgi:hypothetical protein
MRAEERKEKRRGKEETRGKERKGIVSEMRRERRRRDGVKGKEKQGKTRRGDNRREEEPTCKTTGCKQSPALASRRSARIELRRSVDFA